MTFSHPFRFLRVEDASSAADAAAAAEIAYLQKLVGEENSFEATALDMMPQSILDHIMTKKKTLPFLDNFMKLSIEDLKACQFNAGGAKGPFWTLNVNDALSLQLRLVWLQGDVVHDFPDYFILKDMSNATCKIIKTQSTTMSSNWLAPGVYCSVMGQLQEAGDTPQVAALKLTDMTDNNNEVVRAMWPLEIHQLKATLGKEDLMQCSSESSSGSCSCTSSCSCSESESHTD